MFGKQTAMNLNVDANNKAYNSGMHVNTAVVWFCCFTSSFE